MLMIKNFRLPTTYSSVRVLLFPVHKNCIYNQRSAPVKRTAVTFSSVDLCPYTGDRFRPILIFTRENYHLSLHIIVNDLFRSDRQECRLRNTDARCINSRAYVIYCDSFQVSLTWTKDRTI